MYSYRQEKVLKNMIIDIKSEEENILKAIDVLDRFPEKYVPVYFSEDGGKIDDPKDLWANKDRLHSFMKRNPLGFSASSKLCKIDFDFPSQGYSSLFIELEKVDFGTDTLDAMLELLTEMKPVFCIACEWEEYEHRNSVVKRIGKSTVSSFVGNNDLTKFIPGLYFKTLFSVELLARFGVDIKHLKQNFDNVNSLNNNGSYLLVTAFNDAGDWADNAEYIDAFCNETQGFFSKKEVEEAIADCTDVLQMVSRLKPW